MKKLIILLLTLTLILGVFTSCDSKINSQTDETSSSPSEDTTTDTDEETDAEISEESIETTSHTETVNTAETMESIETNNGGGENTDDGIGVGGEFSYTIEKTDGQYYMIVVDYTGPASNNGVLTSVKFSSLNSLKYDVPQGNINADDWKIFQKNLLRSNPMPIYNVEHIWQPKAPEGWFVSDEFDWYGDYYVFTIHNKDESKSLHLVVYREDYYNEYVLPEVAARLDNYDTPENPMRKIQSGDITVYYVGDGDIYEIMFSNGEYFCHLYGDLPSDLTNEEILSFGVEEYLG